LRTFPPTSSIIILCVSWPRWCLLAYAHTPRGTKRRVCGLSSVECGYMDDLCLAHALISCVPWSLMPSPFHHELTRLFFVLFYVWPTCMCLLI
jgi:hypothetical protein